VVVTADKWGAGGIIVKHLLIVGLLLAMPVAALAEPNVALYELQERCGKVAAELFAKEYDHGKVSRVGDKVMHFDYQAHYNARLNKCFFLEMSSSFGKNSKGEMNETRGFRLFDILENREYGTFTSDPELGTFPCFVQDKECRSEPEWNVLVKPYMED
jgi:hypothetical protein